jgi:hypothetical protein
MKAETGQLGQDSLGRSAGSRQPGHDKRRGWPEHDSKDGTDWITSGQDNSDRNCGRTVGTGKLRQDSRDKKLGHTSQYRLAFQISLDSSH